MSGYNFILLSEDLPSVITKSRLHWHVTDTFQMILLSIIEGLLSISSSIEGNKYKF